MECAFTGKITQQVMFCKLTGLMFDKQSILNHLKKFQQCPITGIKLSLKDLEDLQDLQVPQSVQQQPSLEGLDQNLQQLSNLTQQELENLQAQNEELTRLIVLQKLQNETGLEKLAGLVKEHQELKDMFNQYKDLIMNIYRIKTDLEAIKQIGETLNTEEQIKLEIGMQEVINNELYDQVLFWGRIRGIDSNYYILLALKFKDQFEFPSKKFFYATSDFIFKDLPYIEVQFKDRVEQFNDEFFGNPDKVLWQAPPKEDDVDQDQQQEDQDQEKDPEDFLNVSITDSEEEALKKIVQLTEFKEIHRLSYVIRAIEIDCAIVPVGSLKLQTNHELRYDKNFKVENLNVAKDIDRWMHFRQPLDESKKQYMEREDAVFKKDLLENLKNDKPMNCWSIHNDFTEQWVTVRNLSWQGFMGYLDIINNNFGYAYFGNGIKNVYLSLLI